MIVYRSSFFHVFIKNLTLTWFLQSEFNACMKAHFFIWSRLRCVCKVTIQGTSGSDRRGIRGGSGGRGGRRATGGPTGKGLAGGPTGKGLAVDFFSGHPMFSYIIPHSYPLMGAVSLTPIPPAKPFLVGPPAKPFPVGPPVARRPPPAPGSPRIAARTRPLLFRQILTESCHFKYFSSEMTFGDIYF